MRRWNQALLMQGLLSLLFGWLSGYLWQNKIKPLPVVRWVLRQFPPCTLYCPGAPRRAILKRRALTFSVLRQEFIPPRGCDLHFLRSVLHDCGNRIPIFLFIISSHFLAYSFKLECESLYQSVKLWGWSESLHLHIFFPLYPITSVDGLSWNDL